MKRKLLGCGIIAGPLFVVASQLFGQEQPAPVAASTLRGLTIQGWISGSWANSPRS